VRARAARCPARITLRQLEPPAPFHRFHEHFAIDLPGARAVFTTRRGGHSDGPYASLNLGLNTEDDPVTVGRNRATLSALVGAPLATVHQVHGTVIHELREPLAPEPPPDGDGLLITRAGSAPAVLVADCLPVVVAAPGALAVLHAGWRGLAGGILAAGVAAIRELEPTGAVAAAIGPGAGRCCYEVGPDVAAAFAGYGDEVLAGRALDLKLIARRQLERAGVDEVHDIGLCTICSDPGLLYSHRRDGGVTGRQAGVGWLTEDASGPAERWPS